MKKESVRFQKLLYFMILIFIFVSSSNYLFAQAKGRIVGRVTDASSGSYLPGANVMLKGTTFGAATDREGRYQIENAPPGTFTLVVSYIGYDEYSTEVTVTVGSTVKQDVSLKPSYIEMGEVTIVGMREGQIKALSQQRTADNIKNVVAEEQMQRFPDLNTAEVLQRIPGISIERDQGEGRYIHIRGTDSRLSSVSVNGERIASPEDGERYVGMDVISASQVASIEVVKAITPDMDADASIGGSVNLVTRSAFDSDKPVLQIQTGSGYSNQLGKPLWQGAFIYGTKFGPDQKFGLTVTGNYDYSKRSTWDNEMEWGEGQDVNENTVDPFALITLDLRDYIVKRERWNVATNLEFRPNANNQFNIRGMYNNRDDNEYRRNLVIEMDDKEFTDATHNSKAAVLRALKDRLERQNILSLSAGGLHNMGNLNLDYTLAYSRGQTKKPDETDPEFEMNEEPTIALNLSNLNTPQYSFPELASGYELSADNFALKEVAWNNDNTTDEDVLGAVNLKYSYQLGNFPSALKFGGKAHIRKKDKNFQRWVYEWTGDEDLLMTPFVGDRNTSILDEVYKLGPAIDGDKFRKEFKAQKDKLFEGVLDREESDAANYTAEENIFAYYAMNTLNSNKWMALIGFRHEFTNLDNKSNDVQLDAEGEYVSTTPVKAKHNYNNFLPMAHLRYRLTPLTNIRAAFTMGVARPNFYDLVPYRIIFPEDEEILLGNSELEPTTATNLDLMAEHYFQGIGIVSGGVFYKMLDNIIYPWTTNLEGGNYDGYKQTQATNGGSSTLWGIELNWQQQLTFLPGALNGLGVYANYTHTKSEADVGGRLERSVLPGQAGDVANFAISYEKYGFMGRLSLNYHGKFLSEVGDDKDYDIYYRKHTQLDFSASQQLYKGVHVYLEVLNLTNEPLIYYMGKESRPIQREFYSWWMHGGLKYQF